MFNENKQESRVRGRKFLFLTVFGMLDESIELGITTVFFFFSFVPFPHRIVNALQLQDYLKKKKNICWDNQKGVFCFTYNGHCNARSTNEKPPL